MTIPDPVLPVRGSRAERVRSNVCAAFKRSTVSAVTVMASVALLLPEAFPAVSRTVKGPGAAYACVGFCCAEVPPSPKSQAQEVGPPAEVSANCTTELMAGFGVDAVKDAAGAVTAATPARIERPRTASALKSMGNGVMTPRIGRAGGPIGSRPARANGSETGRASVYVEESGSVELSGRVGRILEIGLNGSRRVLLYGERELEVRHGAVEDPVILPDPGRVDHLHDELGIDRVARQRREAEVTVDVVLADDLPDSRVPGAGIPRRERQVEAVRAVQAQDRRVRDHDRERRRRGARAARGREPDRECPGGRVHVRRVALGGGAPVAEVPRPGRRAARRVRELNEGTRRRVGGGRRERRGRDGRLKRARHGGEKRHGDDGDALEEAYGKGHGRCSIAVRSARTPEFRSP